MSFAGKSRGWSISIVVAALSTSLASAHAADLNAANQFFRTGKYAECVDATTKALEENPFTEPFPILRLRAQMQLGRYADALATLDAGLAKFPASVQLRWLGREV